MLRRQIYLLWKLQLQIPKGYCEIKHKYNPIYTNRIRSSVPEGRRILRIAPYTPECGGGGTITKGGIAVNLYCNERTKSTKLTNQNTVPPNGFTTINIKAEDGFCNQENINSNVFGHAVVTSLIPIAGVEVIAHIPTYTQRSEELTGRLSETWFIPTVINGGWPDNNDKTSLSLNISNPNNTSASVDVSVYKKIQGRYTFLETRKPQGPEPQDVCNLRTAPIPPWGEKSFFYRQDTTTTACFGKWGWGESAFGFDIVNASVPVAISSNKTSTGSSFSDDYAELGLRAEEIKTTVYIPQVFKNFLGGYTTAIYALNPSSQTAQYVFRFYDQNGIQKVDACQVLTIEGKQVVSPSLSRLADGRYSAMITAGSFC